ncbi:MULTISPECIES: GNAT family N-acetyltransferase [Pseudonocardia]|uniref:N-acetyltransferase domain-containing protein n=2 Tax=Pseudonocardia TaxID=1847 RepID=A0A1Y2MUR9_PSEAH|nr:MULTISPECIES: GNAT family N-acetyltransferase [Pseudonocardia]OSY38739.1 hypothetical protein BG845_03942 [Pseudonocardia autotrophica]TDN74941.1 acetyltransferase (GNAT) family protein [Pseudonocardia autotrophica]BBF98880.1 hypothetical protein Pdca_00900 [Pseudonocardia autotrophica]GEC27840.1 hypothetical protein PSA01_48690 [Pseudonocardia saturnea]
MSSAREATPADLDGCVDALAEAFADYPFTRHTIAADDHVRRLRACHELLIREVGLPHGRVHVIDGPDGIDAVAVWTPSTPAVEEALTRAAARLAELAGDRAAMATAAESVLAEYRPPTPLWFLAPVGVRPGRQGRGLGRAVLAPGLAAADAGRMPAFLETSDPVNVGIYRRMGFSVLTEIDLPHDGPRTWAMVRPAR